MSWRAGLALALVLSAIGLFQAWQHARHPRPRVQLPLALTPGQPIDLATLPGRAPRWQVQLDGARGLDLVAHPPLIVGDRVIVAGSRIGWAALALADGRLAWRHPASSILAPPLLLSAGLLLVDACPADTATDRLRAGVACATIVDPATGAIRRTVSLVTDTTAGCEPALGAWRLRPSVDDRVVLARGPCRYEVSLTSGFARRLADQPPAVEVEDPDQIVVDPEGLPWTRRLVAGQSVVVDPAGARVVPGLTVLAADAGGPGGIPPAATVVRRDSSLRHDILIGGSWWWPLPEPGAGRGGPVAVSSTRAATVVLFDGDRVAAFAP